jgi:hypothetical protein
MQKRITGLVCAAFSLALVPGLASTPVLAEAIVGVLPAAPGAGGIGIGIGEINQLDKEMTVQNWILCTTQANAESIAKARADGVEPALKIYGDLKTTKACGLFSTLKVILRQSLYESGVKEHRTRVYRASVNLGTEWPTGFVISGVLAE